MFYKGKVFVFLCADLWVPVNADVFMYTCTPTHLHAHNSQRWRGWFQPSHLSENRVSPAYPCSNSVLSAALRGPSTACPFAKITSTKSSRPTSQALRTIRGVLTFFFVRSITYNLARFLPLHPCYKLLTQKSKPRVSILCITMTPTITTKPASTELKQILTWEHFLGTHQGTCEKTKVETKFYRAILDYDLCLQIIHNLLRKTGTQMIAGICWIIWHWNLPATESWKGQGLWTMMESVPDTISQDIMTSWL